MTDFACEPLTAERRGTISHFRWENSSIQVQLPPQSHIHTISIHECASSTKFRFPPSAQLFSKVYELSCSTVRQPKNSDTSSAATVTLPIFHHGEILTGKLHFYSASCTPSFWECDLTPVYNFSRVSSEIVFNGNQTLAKTTVPEFNCFVCALVCQY